MVRVQRDSFPFHRENRSDIKGGPDRGERLAEAVTGLLIAAISPQQGDQAFPQLCFADPAGQRRQQRFGLARGQSYRAALRPLRFEAAEQSEMNPARHHDLRSATSAIKDDNAILPREGPPACEILHSAAPVTQMSQPAGRGDANKRGGSFDLTML